MEYENIKVMFLNWSVMDKCKGKKNVQLIQPHHKIEQVLTSAHCSMVEAASVSRLGCTKMKLLAGLEVSKWRHWQREHSQLHQST